MLAAQEWCHGYVVLSCTWPPIPSRRYNLTKDQALAPYATHFVGVDLAPAMVHAYNSAAHNQGIPSSEMHAVQGNLIDSKDANPEHLSFPEYFNFDLAVVGLGFHHFENPVLAAQKLAERLRPGGVLMIVDFLPHEHIANHHAYAEAKKTVSHMGFSEESVKSIFQSAGVGKDFKWSVLGKGVVFLKASQGHDHTEESKQGEGKNEEERIEVRREVFIARGVKE
jgi:SAM-dependent methyltransferase